MTIILYAGFPRLLESPGFFFLKIPGPGKSWKLKFKVLEKSWKNILKITHFLLVLMENKQK